MGRMASSSSKGEAAATLPFGALMAIDAFARPLTHRWLMAQLEGYVLLVESAMQTSLDSSAQPPGLVGR